MTVDEVSAIAAPAATLNAIDRSVRVFVSYAHEDSAWRNVLFKQSLCTPAGLNYAWTDDMIDPGTSWDDSIALQLERATVAVLLVSKYFLSSVYINRKELPAVLKRRLSDGLKLIWIPIGKPALADEAVLAAIQSAWSLKKPLSAKPHCDPDVIDKIVDEVRASIEAAIDPIGVPLMRDLKAKYEPFTLLEQSGTTRVYRSWDRHLGRPVVIKALSDIAGLDDFVKIVRDAARISDEPNFVSLYDVALTEQRPYCVMRFIEGQNLRTWIEQDNRRPMHVIIRILVKVTRALVAAHALGSAYGNLKPSNIVLSTRNEPFILPIGRRVNDGRGQKALAELERRSPDAEEIAYLPPELFDETVETVSAELSDQYMLGLLAFQLVTGMMPPTSAHMDDIADGLARIRSLGSAAFCALPPVTDLRPDCSEGMARIIARMTSRVPEERYPDLTELLTDVRRQQDVVLARVRESFKRCLDEQKASGKSFFEAVYGRFFARRPDAKALFANIGPRQYQILEVALVMLFSFYEQERAGEPSEPNVLSEVARIHDRGHLKIGMDFYAPFNEALLDTACGDAVDSTSAFDPKCRADDAGQNRLRRAWQEVLQPGMEYMVAKY